MKKIIKHLLSIILLSILLTGCKTIKEGLEGSKKSKSAEEFLIDQKNPLVVPPDFESLPQPTNNTNNNIEKNNKEFNINELIKGSNNQKDEKLDSKNTSLEKSIIKIIKKK